MKKNPVLALEHISFCYGQEENKKIIEDFSFSLFPGEFVLLSGPSGGGKSTLLNIINGVIPSVKKGSLEGKIFFDIDDKWTEITGWTAWERAKILGSVLQNADEQIIYDCCEDEVAFPLENLCVDQLEMKKIVPVVLDTVSLRGDMETATLSGGEKQRLITAATLGMKQKVLLLDEPLANLDRQGALQLLQHLRYLCRQEGYGVIFCEHRLDLVLDFAERILWAEGAKVKTYDKESFRGFFKTRQKNHMALFEAIGKGNLPLGEAVFALDHVSWSPAGIRQKSFQILEGETAFILGENGTGKTSLLHLMIGFEKPDEGRVYAKYQDKKRFRHMGMVLQNPNYQLFMPTVEKEIHYRAAHSEWAEVLIDLFQLQALRTQHPHSLSEGQKRKVGVAAILAMDPAVLILDEPTVGQDDESLHLMLQAILALQKRKKLTLIVVTHDGRLLSHQEKSFSYQKIIMEKC